MRKLICVSAFLLALAEFSVAQNSTLKCETFPGADAGAKMAACIAAMPNGGTADAKALTGSQTITTDVFAGVSKSGTLLLADATYTLTGPPHVSMCLPIGLFMASARTRAFSRAKDNVRVRSAVPC